MEKVTERINTHQGLFLYILAVGEHYTGKSRIREYYQTIDKHLTENQRLQLRLGVREFRERVRKELPPDEPIKGGGYAIFDDVGAKYLAGLKETTEVEIVEHLIKKKMYKKPLAEVMNDAGITEEDMVMVAGSGVDKSPNLLIQKLYLLMNKKDMKMTPTGLIGAVEVSKNHNKKKEVCALNIDKTVIVGGKRMEIIGRKHLPDLTSSILSYCDDLNYYWNGIKKMETSSTWVHLNLIELAKRLGKEWATRPATTGEEKMRFQILRDNFRRDVKTQISIIKGTSWYMYKMENINSKGKKKDGKTATTEYMEGGFFSDFYQRGDNFWISYSPIYNMMCSVQVKWCSVPNLFYTASSYLPKKSGTTNIKSIIRLISEQVDEGRSSLNIREDGYHIRIERLLEYTTYPKSPSECVEEKKWKRDIKGKIERILDFCTNSTPDNILTGWRYKDGKKEDFRTFEDWVTSTVVLDINMDNFEEKKDHQKQLPLPKKEMLEMGTTSTINAPDGVLEEEEMTAKKFLDIIVEKTNREWEEKQRLLNDIENEDD